MGENRQLNQSSVFRNFPLYAGGGGGGGNVILNSTCEV